MSNIVWHRPDGGISVTLCAEGVDVETHAGYLMDGPDRPGNLIGIGIALPVYDEFRDAWRLQAGKVIVDMDAARELRRAQLRRERAPLLAVLDVDYIRADEFGDADGKALAVARKKALRDITKHPGLDAATTVAELRAVVLPAI